MTAGSGRRLMRSKTVTGKRFCYDGSLAEGLIVYPTEKEGTQLTGTKIRIPSDTVEFIRAEIEKAGEIAMGACRDNPSPGSVGEKLLLQRGKSPQFMSYVTPLLIEEGFCSAVQEGRGYVIRHAATQNL